MALPDDLQALLDAVSYGKLELTISRFEGRTTQLSAAPSRSTAFNRDNTAARAHINQLVSKLMAEGFDGEVTIKLHFKRGELSRVTDQIPTTRDYPKA